MMNYEMFKDMVAEQFKNYMPEEYLDGELNIQAVEKVNQTLDGLSFISVKDQHGTTSPTLFINHMYEYYQECGSLEETLKLAAESMISAIQDLPDFSSLSAFDRVKDHVVMVLVNTIQNENLLKTIPNRPFHDLSIIYRYIISKEAKGMQSAIINHHQAEVTGMTEEDLFHAAVENTKRILPPTVRNMNEVMKDIMVTDGMPEEIAVMLLREIPVVHAMYVISNDCGFYGAASMLYEETLHTLAERLEGDLYIIPSSIHDVIAIRAGIDDPNELAEMVNQINVSQVLLEDRLSNQVYHYDKKLRKLTLATDTIHKNLDDTI